MQASIPKAKKTLSILLLGKTGNGKSSTGCTLLNDVKAFDCRGTVDSTTKNCEKKDGIYETFFVCVVDTPGVFDTSMPLQETCKKISSAMCFSPGGYDAIFLILRYGGKFTSEEANAIDHLEKLFGKHIFKFAIIIVTHADNYLKEMKRNPESTPSQFDYLSKGEVRSLQALFEKCGRRYVFCDNLAIDLQNERNKLLVEVQKLVAQNGGKRYSNELFEAAEATLQLVPAYHTTAERKGINVQEEDDELTETFRRSLRTYSGDRLARLFDRLPEYEKEDIVKQLAKVVEEKARRFEACFSKDGTCTLATGEVLRMEHLQQGDKVQVVLPDGTLDYQEIFMFGHADPNTKGSFLVFTTENQKQLSISPGHYLYVKGQGGKMVMVPARNVQVDDALYTYLPEKGTMEFSVVTDIKTETLQGLYNPHTKSGTIIVNGVMASCYTEAFSPVWAHRLLQPVWFLYKMAPWINRIVAKDGMPVWLSFLDIGKSAWEKMGLSAWQ